MHNTQKQAAIQPKIAKQRGFSLRILRFF